MQELKYYAVRKGYVPGIYNSYSDCLNQVKNFPGNEFKSFSNKEYEDPYLEAQKFIDKKDVIIEADKSMNYTFEQMKKKYNTKEKAIAYVDGSHDSSQKKYSFAFLLVSEGKMIELSSPDDNPDWIASMNIAGEVISALQVFRYCIKNEIKELDLFFDYSGIAKWYIGDYEATKPISIYYKDYIATIKDKIKVNFYHVKGHSGNIGNEYVDKMAKKALGLIS